MKMQSISVFLDIAKFANFAVKNVYISGNQGVFHMTYMYFESSLGKV